MKMKGWGKDRGRWVVAERAASADTEALKDWSLQETKGFGLAAGGGGRCPRMAGDELKQKLASGSPKMK